MHAHGMYRLAGSAVALALLAACSSGGGDKATPTTTAGAQGPSLCTRMAADAVSKAVGLTMTQAGAGTSVSCVYTGADETHAGTVVSVTASDAGDDVNRLVETAMEASTGLTAIENLGDAAYVTTVNGRPQGALIVGRRQYSIAVAGSPDAGGSKDAVIALLRLLAAGL